MKTYVPSFILVIIFSFSFSSCDKNNNVVLFSVEDDKQLGQQVAAEVDSTMPVLSQAQYPEVYTYLNGIVNEIIQGGEVAYADEFAWELKVIQNDSVLNAFATPGGYMYIYTGLLKYLNDVDAVAGVIGHEMAHADLRHTSRNLQKQYGVSVLLSLLVGENASQIETIAGQLAGTVAGLKFSRDYEEEADAQSVEYLATTEYACDGAKLFFQKLEQSGQGGGTPQFLSTHPSPENRVEDITDKALEVGCDTTSTQNSGYQQFLSKLPN